MSDFLIGDWVRFQKDGDLVIGQVEYITEWTAVKAAALITDQGEVAMSRVLERRKAPKRVIEVNILGDILTEDRLKQMLGNIFDTDKAIIETRDNV